MPNLHHLVLKIFKLSTTELLFSMTLIILTKLILLEFFQTSKVMISMGNTEYNIMGLLLVTFNSYNALDKFQNSENEFSED